MRWQISFGQLFAALLPFAFALAALCSTLVFASARRRQFKRPALIAWTLGTLILPFTVLPLYLLVCLRRRAQVAAEPRTFISRHAPTFAYAFVVLALGAFYFIHDYRSLDARLARASNARLSNQHARATREYRAALTLADTPHTHKLLGLELAALQQWPEALAELQTAERGGEPDAALSYHIANALDALGRKAEAADEYQKFLAGDSCAQDAPDARCQTARMRVEQTPNQPRAK